MSKEEEFKYDCVVLLNTNNKKKSRKPTEKLQKLHIVLTETSSQLQTSYSKVVRMQCKE